MKYFNRKSIHTLFIIGIFAGHWLGGAMGAAAQTTAFTYQGRLTDANAPANGVYDLQFALYNQFNQVVGAAITAEDVTVTNGIFSVALDFGAAFNESPFAGRTLEIRVRPGASTGAFTALAPRQTLTAAPYSNFSAQANTATNAANADQLGGAAANRFVQTDDSRLSDARQPLSGSPNYVQNNGTASAQTGNFNISGNGRIGSDATVGNDLSVQRNVAVQGTISGNGGGLTALNASNISSGTIADARLSSNVPRLNTANTFTGIQTAGTFNAATQFNLGSNRILSAPGTGNTFAGIRAGVSDPTGQFNSIFGADAGKVNVSGNFNSFFGSTAGQSNNNGYSNSFFGAGAGGSNTSGYFNAFVGASAGVNNQTGINNSFFGTTAGQDNTVGGGNTFIGSGAGDGNTTGANNTAIGSATSVGSGGLTYAAAIGAGATVNGSNRIVLGRTGANNAVGPDAVSVPGTMEIKGNIKQSLESNGLPKAMVRLGLQNGQLAIINCYNTVTGETGGSCGFTLTGNTYDELREIDFGFPLYRRFILFTANSPDTTVRVFNPGNGGLETRTILTIEAAASLFQGTVIIY